MSVIAAGLRRIWDAVFAVTFAISGMQMPAFLGTYRHRLDQSALELDRQLSAMRSSRTPDSSSIARIEAVLPDLRQAVVDLGGNGLGRLRAFLANFDGPVVEASLRLHEPSLPLTIEAAAYGAGGRNSGPRHRRAGGAHRAEPVFATPENIEGRMKRLQGRIAVITGASRGIGRAVAERFAVEGAHVVALARTVGALEELDDAIVRAGGSTTLVPIDLAELDKLDSLGPSLYERFGKVDILVGNAGALGTLGPVTHHDAKDWEEVFKINVHANWRLMRTLEPALRLSDAGRAIFVTSGAAHRFRAYWGAYATSKIALEMMVKTWAQELAATAIRVNLVSPGPVATRMRAAAFPGEDQAALPQPANVTGAFVDLAAADCQRHGETVEAY